MIHKFDLLTVSMALGIASYLAIILDCLARNEFGLSDGEIAKSTATFAIAVVLGADALGEGQGVTK